MTNIEENILARIGGDYVAAAINALPDPKTATEEFRESVSEYPTSLKFALPVDVSNQSIINP